MYESCAFVSCLDLDANHQRLPLLATYLAFDPNIFSARDTSAETATEVAKPYVLGWRVANRVRP
jgi:hypothetical protein